MNDLEDLEVVVIHQNAGLPDLLLGLQDSAGDDVDLTSGYDSFSAKIVDENGQTTSPGTLTVTGTTTGFRIVWPVDGLTLPAGKEYTVQCRCRRTADSRYRDAYCLLQVLTGF